MIFRPEYIARIMPYVGAPFVKILTGVRRSGKSTLLKMLMQELKKKGVGDRNLIYYNFDSLEHGTISTAQAMFDELKSKLAPEGTTCLFLDEVQEIPAWEKALNSLLESEACDVDIFVTGSNSRMMSSEISTHLTGRYISFPVYPLSFREFLTFKAAISPVGNPCDELIHYLRSGGFPAVTLRSYTVDEIDTIVRDIYNATIFTDIVKRAQIRKIDQFERVVRYAFSNVGRTFSAASIAKYLKSERRTIDSESVYNYLKHLETAYILYRCPRYDLQGREILKTQEKFYLADPTLLYCIFGRTPDSVSPMLENIIYLELKRRGYEVFVGKVGDAEIDFVAVRREEKIYVQVTLEMTSPDTARREYGRLLDLPDNFPKYVLCAAPFATGNYQGIKTMHIADFLLETSF